MSKFASIISAKREAVEEAREAVSRGDTINQANQFQARVDGVVSRGSNDESPEPTGEVGIPGRAPKKTSRPKPATPATSRLPHEKTRPNTGAKPVVGSVANDGNSRQELSETPVGKKVGKRSDPDYSQVSAWIRKQTHQDVKLALLKEGQGREFSELVENLLTSWLHTNT